MVPANNTSSFVSPVEGGTLFLPAIERLQTLYPGAYARSTTSTSEGAELMNIDENLDVKVSVRNHPGAAVLDSSLGGGDFSPTRLSSLVETWLEGESAYRGQ